MGNSCPLVPPVGFEWARSAAADVLRPGLAGRDERHHRPQLGADLLDLVGPALFPQGVEPLATAPVLGHPFLGERAVADLTENGPHLRFRLLAYDARAAGGSPYSAVSEMENRM